MFATEPEPIQSVDVFSKEADNGEDSKGGGEGEFANESEVTGVSIMFNRQKWCQS